MANSKAFYYFEVSIPSAVKDAYPDHSGIGALRQLLDVHITDTDSKHSKILRDYVFTDVLYHTSAEKDAFSMEFINARHYDQYKTVVAEFRTWANANHGVEFSNEVSNTVPFDAHDKQSADDSELTYGVAAREHFFEQLPASRGF